jgi:hypothetical protein
MCWAAFLHFEPLFQSAFYIESPCFSARCHFAPLFCMPFYIWSPISPLYQGLVADLVHVLGSPHAAPTKPHGTYKTFDYLRLIDFCITQTRARLGTAAHFIQVFEAHGLL